MKFTLQKISITNLTSVLAFILLVLYNTLTKAIKEERPTIPGYSSPFQGNRNFKQLAILH